MKLCEYGCGQEAKHQFKNGKWCCSKPISKCPVIIKKLSNKLKGYKHSIESKIKMSISSKGHRHSLKSKMKMSINNKLTIRKIKKKYPFFSKIEEMRYNPDKSTEKEIQVHCKNHNCKNSREQGGWFTPTKNQITMRREALEKARGFGESNFYCCDECKDECPLYNVYSDPLKDILTPYTSVEYQTFRTFVLERDNYKCQYCEEKAEHVHHERPQKLEPFFALDPDFGLAVCRNCHYKYGHQNECSTGNLASKGCN